MATFLCPQSLWSSDTKPKWVKLRKYDVSCIEFGFIEGSNRRPQCVICLRFLANQAMNQAKQRWQCNTWSMQANPKTFSTRRVRNTPITKKGNGLPSNCFRKSTEGDLFGSSADCEKKQEAAYNWRLPAVVELCEVMFGAEAANQQEQTKYLEKMHSNTRAVLKM